MTEYEKAYAGYLRHCQNKRCQCVDMVWQCRKPENHAGPHESQERYLYEKYYSHK